MNYRIGLWTGFSSSRQIYLECSKMKKRSWVAWGLGRRARGFELGLRTPLYLKHVMWVTLW